jgi:hypothetical protein
VVAKTTSSTAAVAVVAVCARFRSHCAKHQVLLSEHTRYVGGFQGEEKRP